MSLKNFMSYGDAETVLTGFANDIKSKDTAYTTITYSDWLAMSDAQKEAGKYYITGVPGADGTIQIDLMTKLWENPDPTSEMAENSEINLSSDDYDLLLVISYEGKSIMQQGSSQIVTKGSNIDIGFSYATGYGARSDYRYLTFVNNTKYKASNCYVAVGTTSRSVDNDRIIPYRIYGIKLHHEIEVSAIGLGCVKMTKLWENSDPTGAMASGTTFVLSSSDYDHLLTIVKLKNDSTLCSSIMSPKDNGIALTIATEGKVASRNVLFSSATSGTFYSGYFNGAVDNDYVIPITIYGIKLT